jgi:hypothetical protein
VSVKEIFIVQQRVVRSQLQDFRMSRRLQRSL